MAKVETFLRFCPKCRQITTFQRVVESGNLCATAPTDKANKILETFEISCKECNERLSAIEIGKKK